MAIKKYLTTPEDLLALKDTDTKIYTFYEDKYYKFVDGVLCFFNEKDELLLFNTVLVINHHCDCYPYILIEEPISNATEKDIGKMCWFFFDEDEDSGNYGVLKYIRDGKFHINDLFSYDNCKRLTFEEIVELTGYMEK